MLSVLSGSFGPRVVLGLLATSGRGLLQVELSGGVPHDGGGAEGLLKTTRSKRALVV